MRTKGTTMASKLLEMAEHRWRRLNGAHLLPLVRADGSFLDGIQTEPQEEKGRAPPDHELIHNS